MDFNKNYYSILEVSKDSSEKEIKKAYYKLSFTHHPDRGGDSNIFSEITEAYNILMEETREEYDIRSRFGKNYDESKEFLSFEFENSKNAYDEEKLEKNWNTNDLNIIIKVDDDFGGRLEYERWVICKDCKGNGRDTKSKIEIKDENGNIRYFDGCDGCDFCEGTGKDPHDNDCYFCGGIGKVGWSPCMSCEGDKRILGKQKLEGVKFPKGEKEHRVESMGHFDKYNMGMVGHLWLVKKN